MYPYKGQVILCSICGEEVQSEEDKVYTGQFIYDKTHPLYECSYSSMHRRCFLKWEHRQEFIHAFNDIRRQDASLPLYDRMDKHGNIESVKRPKNEIEGD